MPAAELRVLGPVELVSGNGSAIALAAKQTRLLAALVVADGRSCGVDELVESVWNGSPPASARNLVQVYVSQLRKTLPDGLGIVTRGGAYALEREAGRLDAARFERLLEEGRAARANGNAALAASLAGQALALWRGRAFGELAYEEFARAESERLEELRVVAVEERLDALLALGLHSEALAEVLAHAADNPFREGAHELAMLALYRCERQADALEYFATYRAHLDEELGLEPGPELRALQRRILEHDPELSRAAVDGRAGVSALPAPATPLVGRGRELAELRMLLERRDSRLVVLTGAGGSGKTRLALEVARAIGGSFANGVVLVELAPLRNPALVLPAIARVLEIAVEDDESPTAALAAALASQELLMVVDNAEHVREAAVSLAELLSRAPRLTCLVTSRAVLHVSGEHVFPVAPLPEDDAVELFVQCAARLLPAFDLSAENTDDVREICRRVDGLPLGIELAAARIRTLSPHVLRHRLASRLTVLRGGPRDLPARQQTLRETVAWSVDLLDERERAVFTRLAVFPAGATLEAAEAVCGADLDTLGTLVDDNLVWREDGRGEARFRMLETVREYALELLEVDRLDAERALAEYVVRFADELRLGASEADLTGIVDRLDPEIENLRAALAASVASGDSELQVRLAGGLSRYWQYRGPVAEGLEWIEQALSGGDGPATPARAHALRSGAGLAWMQGDVERATELAEAAIPVAIETGAVRDEGAAHTVLGIVANARGDRVRARYHHQRSLELSEQLGVEPVVQKLNLGCVALDAEEYEEAIALFEDVLASHRRHERPAGIGYALLNLGVAHYELGDEAARQEFEEARASFAEAGFRTQLAYALQGLAATAAKEARFEEAGTLLGEARRELDALGVPEIGSDFAPALVSETKARAREALGDEAFEAAYGADATVG
jgi:predicted ATPase/DNA-binding SARP family transcriptional activator